MADQGTGMSDLWKRLRFVFMAIIVYRIGTHIPIPGIDPDRLAQLFEQNQGTILEMFNMFSGGALERMSVFALNVVPYISAAIIMQLFSNSIPFLIELKKDGQAGRNKITQYTRYGTVLLAFIQASALAVTLSASGLAFTPGTSFFVSAVFSVVAGTVFLMWLGEQVSERGIGNGISIIIATSILTGIPGAIGQALEQSRQGDLNILLLIGIGLLAMVVIAIVVFIERGQRRITVNYAQRQQGRRMMQAQTSHLPFKVNMAGVIPAIFASTFLLFPASLSTWFGQSESLGFLQSISLALNPGQPLYILVFATLIISFCFIWLALTFNTKEVSDNLKRSGAYIAGIRPGEQTANYIDAVLARLTVFGAIYLTLICLLPLALINFAGVSFYFGGTSVLIIVVVLMDFMAQVQSHLMSGQYASLMKKANLKNYKR
ncbi:preprotein translocase subunit SecY [Gammaproteobacteria bacterium]|mgnify:FL=1|jgi:preprotein translocase subunit SecY|nr:preprotein translocase subunit SecY [Gammaproteobacteria bacterium]MDG1248845.1 preprotein translocase subunit SecY [SAR86 cluster bacterium]MDA9142939.1 preprotein translocase subunit SecY [Gammaproteobacteria bacterium]MDA9997800.1 preprotein translocase subunit SecY [Gammaproteobacteria bacterium]MDC0367817.1 preprotein translocase subunit SecY [Gammaproteobacteria bacterium]|tara:strand:+ start:3621 stop:4916 length:1296 start_codon:yes stop_codon:yes gene_type:complete